MKHLFIPYELAILAKDKGFKENCISWYYKEEWNAKDAHIFNTFSGNDFNSRTDLEDVISCPLYQQIIDWFRDKGIIVVEKPAFDWVIYVESNGA